MLKEIIFVITFFLTPNSWQLDKISVISIPVKYSNALSEDYRTNYWNQYLGTDSHKCLRNKFSDLKTIFKVIFHLFTYCSEGGHILASLVPLLHALVRHNTTTLAHLNLVPVILGMYFLFPTVRNIFPFFRSSHRNNEFSIQTIFKKLFSKYCQSAELILPSV